MAVIQRLSSSIVAPLPSELRSSFHHVRRYRLIPSTFTSRDSDNSITRRQLIQTAAIISVSSLGGKALASEDPLSVWERVILPIDPGVVLLDIAFVPDDPSHGFLLGAKNILETKDAGNTWAPSSIPSVEDEDFNYRFNYISFKGKEGWIIGKPALLLYTADAGDTWKRMPLNSELPIDMYHWDHGSKSSTQVRPRFFDSNAKKACWDKAEQVPGRDPERWRIDAAGNIVCKRLHSCNGCLCYEYDHILPFSKGGDSVKENCQILQTRVNRLKSNQNDLDQKLLKGYSCDIKFSDDELDAIEMAVYGSVVRPKRQCVVGSISALIGKYNSRDHIISCNSQKNG